MWLSPDPGELDILHVKRGLRGIYIDRRGSLQAPHKLPNRIGTTLAKSVAAMFCKASWCCGS